MNHSYPTTQKPLFYCAIFFAVVSITLSGCGGEKEKKSSQSLASVNGVEVTVSQLNEELQRSNIPPAQQDAARAQLLESLIDRQIVQGEAAKDKLDRDPKVMQAIERAKAQILVQAYLQKKVGNSVRPTKEEVDAYFTQHPEFFSHRKQLELQQLIIASNDMTDALKTTIDGAKSLDEVALWLGGRNVKFARNQVVRSTADLPVELSRRLLAMSKGQMFIVKEGERSLLVAISDIKDAPITLEAAAPQIEQFLLNKKNKDIADAEVKRLRGEAKIEYLTKLAPAAGAATKADASGSSSAPSASASAAPDDANAANVRGVAGLK